MTRGEDRIPVGLTIRNDVAVDSEVEGPRIHLGVGLGWRAVRRALTQHLAAQDNDHGEYSELLWLSSSERNRNPAECTPDDNHRNVHQQEHGPTSCLGQRTKPAGNPERRCPPPRTEPKLRFETSCMLYSIMRFDTSG